MTTFVFQVTAYQLLVTVILPFLALIGGLLGAAPSRSLTPNFVLRRWH
jgi:hypothetical protein